MKQSAAAITTPMRASRRRPRALPARAVASALWRMPAAKRPGSILKCFLVDFSPLVPFNYECAALYSTPVQGDAMVPRQIDCAFCDETLDALPVRMRESLRSWTPRFEPEPDEDALHDVTASLLAIVGGLSGNLWVTTEEGKGSTFSVTLPHWPDDESTHSDTTSGGPS